VTPGDYIRVAHPDPHVGRGRDLLAAHPELRLLAGPMPSSALWVAALVAAQVLGTVRPMRLRRVALVDGWTVVNLVVQIAAIAAFVFLAGWDPLKYLLASTVLAVGLHPLGARWIQEHYVFEPGQETYSYYGPLNKVAFNVGYHNEHHDLISIPWSRLPRVRAIAPEFYAPLRAHHSLTMLLVTFLRDRQVTLFSRIVR
jgi:sphingolipid 4-desaturase/C4-monooxygenase